MEDTYSGGDSRTNLSSYEYNKQREMDRRKSLEAIYVRSLKQIEDEKFLLVESKRLQDSHRKLEIERDILFRLLNGGAETVSLGHRPSISLLLDQSVAGSIGGSGPKGGAGRMKKRKMHNLSGELRGVDSGEGKDHYLHHESVLIYFS